MTWVWARCGAGLSDEPALWTSRRAVRRAQAACPQVRSTRWITRPRRRGRRVRPRQCARAAGPEPASCTRSRPSAHQPRAVAHVLCCVQAIRRAIHSGVSVSRGCYTQHHFGTRCRRPRGPTRLSSFGQPYLPSGLPPKRRFSGCWVSIPSPVRMASASQPVAHGVSYILGGPNHLADQVRPWARIEAGCRGSPATRPTEGDP